MTAPSSHRLTVNALNLHYLEAGEGDPILLLHGFPTSSHLYRNILPELAKKLPTLEAPLRLIYGENDRVLPDVAKTMKRLHELRPDAELTALPNCGHFLQEDAPESIGQLIGEFINRP